MWISYIKIHFINIMVIKFNDPFIFPDSERRIIFLIFYMDDLEYMVILGYVLFHFHLYNHQN